MNMYHMIKYVVKVTENFEWSQRELKLFIGILRAGGESPAVQYDTMRLEGMSLDFPSSVMKRPQDLH